MVGRPRRGRGRWAGERSGRGGYRAVMAQARLNRDEFFDKLSGLGEAELKKALWTLYWRGSAPVRDRIAAAIDPAAEEGRGRTMKPAPDPVLVLGEVTEFASLARKGAYLAGDRRVSPKERTRWRLTFRRLAGEAQDALRGDDMGSAAAAVSVMIDLACESRDVDYFRSEDPVEAARFVVSDAVRALWLRTREEEGPRFAERAAEQLLRWESEYGWTRRGDGWVAARETSLARVLSDLLVVPDLWAGFANQYLQALDRAATGGRKGQRSRRGRQQRAEGLRVWHALLIERLIGSDHEELLDRLVTHESLAGPEVTFLQARLARERGDLEAARSLVKRCLASLPGHRDFHAFASDIGA